MEVKNNYAKVNLPNIGDIVAIKDGSGNYIWSWMVENHNYGSISGGYYAYTRKISACSGFDSNISDRVKDGIPFRVINKTRNYAANEIKKMEYCGDLEGDVISQPAWALNQVAIVKYTQHASDWRGDITITPV